MKRQLKSGGFTLIEILLSIAIGTVITVASVPFFLNSLNAYRMSAAVSAVSGAISSTRFQAIMHGCAYQVVFTSATMSYQVYNELPATVGASCASSFSAVGSAIPVPSAGPITLPGTSFTFTFNSNGTVTQATSPSGTAFKLQNSLKSIYVYVSGVGDVETCQPTSLCTCSATTPTVCN
jgi:prepilin-type N-terminal cleavage/methylation domain-containing protein